MLIIIDLYGYEKFRVIVGSGHSETFRKDYLLIIKEINAEVDVTSDDILIILDDRCQLKIDDSYSNMQKFFESYLRLRMSIYNTYLLHAGAVQDSGKLVIFKSEKGRSKTVSVLESVKYRQGLLLGDDRVWVNLKEKTILPFHRYVTLNRPRAYFLTEGVTLKYVIFRCCELLKFLSKKPYKYFADRPKKIRNLTNLFNDVKGLSYDGIISDNELKTELKKSTIEFEKDWNYFLKNTGDNLPLKYEIKIGDYEKS